MGRIRVIFGAASPLAAWGSWVARVDHENYAIALLFSAVGLLLLALLLPYTEEAEAGPKGFRWKLRQDPKTALDAADKGVPAEQIEPTITGDVEDDDREPDNSDEDDDVISVANYIAGNMALSQLLDNAVEATGPLEHCDLRLYLYDEEVKRLVPIHTTGHVEDPTTWEVGKGATGVAYERKEFVLVQGDAVWNDTFGLTTKQQERYKRLVAVASTPVLNASGDVIAVLSATSSHFKHALASAEGQRDLNLTALLIARVLVELLQWFDD
jgi:hypothetical protein